MADVFVDKDAVGSGSGADWANAYTTLAGALTGSAAAGNRYLVAHTHTPTALASAITHTTPGVINNPCQILCVTKSGGSSWSGLATTAVIQTTLSNAMAIIGFAYIYGITFIAGDTTGNCALNLNGATASGLIFENCGLWNGGSNANGRINAGTSSAAISNRIEMINSTLKFANTAQSVALSSGRFIWRDTPGGGLASGSSVPATLFTNASLAANLEIRNVDLSTISGTLMAASATTNVVKGERIKTHASVTKLTTPTGIGTEGVFLNCDSAETNYKFEKYNLMAAQTVDTSVYRTTPPTEATDGVTPISAKIVSTANCRPMQPFVSIPISRPNTVEDTSVTVIVYGTTAGSMPTNADIWVEVEYSAGGGTSPLGGKATNGCATVLTTPTTYSSDTTSTWATAPANKFAMSVTFTPTQKGPITARVYVGAASATYYVDPMPYISGQTIPKAYAA